MKYSLEQIDERIVQVIELLEKHQAKDGGFRTLQKNPQLSDTETWRDEFPNAFLPANVLLPLTRIKNERASRILERGFNYLLANKTPFGPWHYFKDRNAQYFIPFETDTNSLLSHIGTFLGKQTLPKNLFISQLNDDGHFNLWFKPELLNFWSGPLTYMCIHRNWIKGLKSLPFRSGVVNRPDAEFCVTANNLLFLGRTQETELAVNRLCDELESSDPIQLIYYPSQTIAHFLFARAGYYGKMGGLERANKAMLRWMDTTMANENECEFLNVLTASTLLFTDLDHSAKNMVIEKSWSIFPSIKTPFAFYCSNNHTDVDTKTGLNNAYFGGPALTISLYLEFLNLLRMREYEKAFGH